MGDATRAEGQELGDRRQFRRKVGQCLETLGRMHSDNGLSHTSGTIGLEIELNLLDHELRPSMTNEVVLTELDDSLFTSEVSQHNIELNVPPRSLQGASLLELETDLKIHLQDASIAAQEAGSLIAMIGMVPTLTLEDFDIKWLSDNTRYAQLNDQIFKLRGEKTSLSIEGKALPGRRPEHLRSHADSILPEAAGTSLQLHLQVTPENFAAHWNAAQCLAGPQIAIAGNSAFLLNKALWHETRIPLFLQATDTRPEELQNQGVRPRVWFGERWIDSALDLFEENLRYFPGLLTNIDSEDPLETWESGRPPSLNELRLHNGTIWRWNRPVYDVVEQVAHLRVENRVLPAGPTIVDMVANAAFFYGVQVMLATEEYPLWTKMSFAAAEENFHSGARDGFEARLYWPSLGWVNPSELVLRALLPLAQEGLRRLAVSEETSDKYLTVIEQRCLTQRTGSWWQRQFVAQAEDRGMSRELALSTMLSAYLELAQTGQPVHTWPLT